MILLILIIISLSYAYDENFVKHCVNLAQSTYCVTSTEEWNCKTCESSIKLEYIVENSGSKAIQGFDKYTNSLFVSFPGSSNLHNWIENIQVNKISPYNNSVEIEKGFYKAYNFIKKDMIINLSLLTKKYNTNKLLITGHSLGGAMATIMTYDILNLFPEYNIIYSITFGSPRVGNNEFANDFNKYNITSYRLTHYYDIVPHLPQEFLKYKHISNEIWYNEDNSKYKICNDLNNEDNNCSNSCSPLHCTSADDHLNYLNTTMGNDSC